MSEMSIHCFALCGLVLASGCMSPAEDRNTPDSLPGDSQKTPPEVSAGTLRPPRAGTSDLDGDQGTTLNLDEKYRLLLKTASAAVAIARQQPENAKALLDSCQKLREQIQQIDPLVSQDTHEREDLSTPRSGDELIAVDDKLRRSIAEPPAGPVAPSQQPAPPEDVRKGREATIAPRPPAGPQLDNRERPVVLGPYQAGELHERCRQAMAKVESIESVIRAGQLARAHTEFAELERQLRAWSATAARNELP